MHSTAPVSESHVREIQHIFGKAVRPFIVPVSAKVQGLAQG